MLLSAWLEPSAMPDETVRLHSSGRDGVVRMLVDGRSSSLLSYTTLLHVLWQGASFTEVVQQR